ncbi:hypothetical protein V5O48_008466 [Marasmius crinis-equi]|uniref:Uncharacterized protein n=1 Tax=Marasmius crinis-equi TaxID=585013 RepID=A0ABR3FEG8_9AGAR
MGYTIHISDTLTQHHPTLLPKVRALFSAEDVGEDIDVVESASKIDGVEAVEYMDDFDVIAGQLCILWVDAQELLTRIKQKTLTHLLNHFRRCHDQTYANQKTLIVAYGLEDSSPIKTAVEIEMCRYQVQYPVLYTSAVDLDAAAFVIYVFMHGLWKAIANPTPEEKLAIYRGILLQIPTMNEERVGLVTSRFTNYRSLHEYFKEVEPDIERGVKTLNSSLFAGHHVPSDPPEEWVESLYVAFRS